MARQSKKANEVSAVQNQVVNAQGNVQVGNAQEQPKVEQVVERDVDNKVIKENISRMLRATSAAFRDVRAYVGNPARLLRLTKQYFPAEYLPLLEEKFNEVSMEVRRQGNCYIENVTVKDKESGESREVERIHMCEWRKASLVKLLPDKTHKVCGYRFVNGKELEPITTINSVDELHITRNIVKHDIDEKIIDGKVYKCVIDRVEACEFRPEIVVDLTLKEFEKRFKLAMQVVFPNGFEKPAKK